MTIEKLSSGSYRVTQMSDGIRYRVTVDHKPSKAEATLLLAERIQKAPAARPENMSFNDALDAYIRAKDKVLSPSSIVGYRSIQRRLPDDFKARKLRAVTSAHVQALVNDYSEGRSPKTVSCMAGLVMSVLKFHDVEVRAPKLPQKEKKAPYIPTEEDVRKIFAQAAGTPYEVPLALAAFGLRRSEVCALLPDDLDGNVLSISKALVENEAHEWVLKPTKTTDSTRTIVIPDDLADKIRAQGYIFKGYPGMINKALQKAQDAAGVPRFSLHKLRHFYASYAHQKGMTDKQIQEMGGWKTDSVMKAVYQHAMELESAKASMSASLSQLLPTNLPTKEKE